MLKIMLKKLKIIFCIFVIILLGSILFKESIYIKNKSLHKDNNNTNYSENNSKPMSFYIESDNGYIPSNTIPDGGYLLNGENSYCEINGNNINATITYDFNTKTIGLSSLVNKKTKCFMYFDIVRDNVGPVINSVSKTSSDKTSITVSVSATDDSQITKYYYSINNGSYAESTSNTYKFSSLAVNTSYTIKVYAIDEYGNQSDITTTTFSTENYKCSIGELNGTQCIVSASSQNWVREELSSCREPVMTYAPNCDICGCYDPPCSSCNSCYFEIDYSFVDCYIPTYYCASGWTIYSGSDYTLKCSKPAS